MDKVCTFASAEFLRSALHMRTFRGANTMAPSSDDLDEEVSGDGSIRPTDEAEVEESGDGASGDDDDSGGDGDVPFAAVQFERLLPPTGGGLAHQTTQFLAERWGDAAAVSWDVEDGVLPRLRAGFCDGDAGEVIAACRKEDNSKYSPDEIGAMEGNLENGKRTLNLPFCFTAGPDTMERDPPAYALGRQRLPVSRSPTSLRRRQPHQMPSA